MTKENFGFEREDEFRFISWKQAQDKTTKNNIAIFSRIDNVIYINRSNNCVHLKN